MSEYINITTPLRDEDLEKLKIGDQVKITGRIYTARDAAHARLIEIIRSGDELPFDIKDQIIYYTGPCPPRPGKIIGSAGPTTSYRMDPYTPQLLDIGLKGIIGKGDRNDDVLKSIEKNKAIYFIAIGGLGALISQCIKKVTEIAFSDLGTESIKELWVDGLPCIVGIDNKGNDIYRTERKKYERR